MKIPIITIGTGAPGGIDSVIKGYIDNGLFYDFEHIRLISHMGKSRLNDLILFVSAIMNLLYLSVKRKNLILHCHMSYNGSFFRKLSFLLIAKLFKNKTIIHLHGSEFKEYFSSRGYVVKKLVVWMIHSCDYFVVLSEGWSEYILSISNVKPIVIHNYVDISPNDINREKNTILFLGAFIKRKGIYELLRACSMLPLDFHLHLCGSGEDARVEDMVTELDLKERITFHGWVGNEDKKKLLASCSVMVLPAFNEGLPMTIIESMACEIPVLTTPVGAIPELIVDSISGYLVEPGEVSELASKLEFILSSPQELQDVVKTAKNIYTENFTSLQVLPKWKDIYDQASIR